jgi:hypothetical protein
MKFTQIYGVLGDATVNGIHGGHSGHLHWIIQELTTYYYHCKIVIIINIITNLDHIYKYR